jgi:restriction system protein
MADPALTSAASQAGWLIAKMLIGAFLFALALGLVGGLLTYGQPTRKNKRGKTFMDDALELGMDITHGLIDYFRYRLGRKQVTPRTWLSDQQIIALLRGMRPDEFEETVAKMFVAFGYAVDLVGGRGDGGIDLAMTKNGRHHVVQCKKYITQKVTPSEVRDFFGAMGDRHLDGKGFFVTTNIFTREAEAFAEGKPIELVDGSLLVDWIRESGALAADFSQTEKATASLRSASNEIETCPKCGRPLVIRRNHRDGSRFLGCSGFPKCRFTRPV